MHWDFRFFCTKINLTFNSIFLWISWSTLIFVSGSYLNKTQKECNSPLCFPWFCEAPLPRSGSPDTRDVPWLTAPGLAEGVLPLTSGVPADLAHESWQLAKQIPPKRLVAYLWSVRVWHCSLSYSQACIICRTLTFSRRNRILTASHIQLLIIWWIRVVHHLLDL